MSFQGICCRTRLLIPILLLLVSLSLAQSTDVVGLVFDEQTGKPLVGVRIYTKSGKKLGTTNGDGRFEIVAGHPEAILVFRHHSYVPQDVDLSDYANLIGIEIGMISEALEMQDVVTTDTAVGSRVDFEVQSMEEIEQFQGMRLDLSDHLKQMAGVSGIGEYSSELNVYGGRSEDAQHYLGRLPIPNLRHLDFGFPGNQSVLNPRMLEGIAIRDNPAQGPINQGNSSAVVYQLKEGDPNNMHLDLVLGTVSREFNFNGYWEGRTYLASGRYLSDFFLTNLGGRFFTLPKEKRLPSTTAPCEEGDLCKEIEDKIDISSGDAFFSTFEGDTTGSFSRFNAMFVVDTFVVTQDAASSFHETEVLNLEEGSQRGGVLSYERYVPGPSSEWEYAVGAKVTNKTSISRDTFPDAVAIEFGDEWWYPPSGEGVETIQDKTEKSLMEFTLSAQRHASEPVGGGFLSLAWEGDFNRDARLFIGATTFQTNDDAVLYANNRFLGKWNRPLTNKSQLDLSAGVLALNAEPYYPLASARYTYEINDKLRVFGETGIRQGTLVRTLDYAEYGPVVNTSGEVKLGFRGLLPTNLNYGLTLYGRYYHEPSLPEPDAFWFYRQTRKAERAEVYGANVNMAWKPNHHFGIGLNASHIQGDYYLEDGGVLPWDAARSLDLVANLRYLPRSDSLISVIMTYRANRDEPLYAYNYQRALENETGEITQEGALSIRQFDGWPTASRGRLDLRLNLDLKSKWRPLHTLRFFFEADNILAQLEDTQFSWLGGHNARQRGWTLPENTRGTTLEPVITRGLGLFMFIGVEMKFLF